MNRDDKFRWLSTFKRALAPIHFTSWDSRRLSVNFVFTLYRLGLHDE